MLTFLDLLVVVFMVLTAMSLLAVCLMFLVRSPRIKKIAFYFTAALGIYAASVGIRIGTTLFPIQTAIGVAVAIAAIAAIILMVKAKDNAKQQTLARIIAAASLVIGIVNGFLL